MSRKWAKKMKSIAFFNNKGGVSKTTTVLNIAYILGEVYKRKVLVVDCDGQQNASRFLADELSDVGIEKTLVDSDHRKQLYQIPDMRTLTFLHLQQI